MAVTIVATAKATNANSFLSLADADTYMDGLASDTEWDAATTDQQNRALKSATDRLDQERYHGRRTDANQRLSFPRTGIYDRDGDLYDQDTIPRPVEEATAELANAIIKGEYDPAETGLEAFKNVKVGPLDVTPNQGKQNPTELPEYVRLLLEPVLIGRAGAVVPLHRT